MSSTSPENKEVRTTTVDCTATTTTTTNPLLLSDDNDNDGGASNDYQEDVEIESLSLSNSIGERDQRQVVRVLSPTDVVIQQNANGSNGSSSNDDADIKKSSLGVVDNCETTKVESSSEESSNKEKIARGENNDAATTTIRRLESDKYTSNKANKEVTLNLPPPSSDQLSSSSTYNKTINQCASMHSNDTSRYSNFIDRYYNYQDDEEATVKTDKILQRPEETKVLQPTDDEQPFDSPAAVPHVDDNDANCFLFSLTELTCFKYLENVFGMGGAGHDNKDDSKSLATNSTSDDMDCIFACEEGASISTGNNTLLMTTTTKKKKSRRDKGGVLQRDHSLISASTKETYNTFDDSFRNDDDDDDDDKPQNNSKNLSRDDSLVTVSTKGTFSTDGGDTMISHNPSLLTEGESTIFSNSSSGSSTPDGRDIPGVSTAATVSTSGSSSEFNKGDNDDGSGINNNNTNTIETEDPMEIIRIMAHHHGVQIDDKLMRDLMTAFDKNQVVVAPHHRGSSPSTVKSKKGKGSIPFHQKQQQMSLDLFQGGNKSHKSSILKPQKFFAGSQLQQQPQYDGDEQSMAILSTAHSTTIASQSGSGSSNHEQQQQQQQQKAGIKKMASTRLKKLGGRLTRHLRQGSF